MKALGTKTLIVFNLVFAKNNILLCLVTFFLMIDLYFLIPAVIAKIFNPTSELATPTTAPINERNAEIETYPQTAESKIRKCPK